MKANLDRLQENGIYKIIDKELSSSIKSYFWQFLSKLTSSKSMSKSALILSLQQIQMTISGANLPMRLSFGTNLPKSNRVYFNNRISRLLYKDGYNGILTFLRARQSLYYVRPSLDINSALSILISVLPHIHRRILCACILVWCQFLFLCLLCIGNKKKHLIE